MNAPYQLQLALIVSMPARATDACVVVPIRPGAAKTWSGFLAWFELRVTRVDRERRTRSRLATAAVVVGELPSGRVVRALVSRSSDTGGAVVRARVLRTKDGAT